MRHILLFLFSILLITCNRQGPGQKFTSLGEKLAYPVSQGGSEVDEELFSAEIPEQLKSILASFSDDPEAFGLAGKASVDFDDDSTFSFLDESENNNTKANNLFKTRRRKKKHSEDDDKDDDEEAKHIENASIDYTILRQLTDCKIPRLSLGNKVLLRNVDWLILNYCVLGIDVGHNYPHVPKLKKKYSALSFLFHLNKKAIHQNHISHASLAVKLAYFERLVLVSRFRQLTVQEKEISAKIIKHYGIAFGSTLYLLKWAWSDFYKNHFNYKKEPQSGYQSYIIDGEVVSDADVAVSEASLTIIDTIDLYPGFVLSADSDSAGKFGMQFYWPETKVKHHRKEKSHRHHRRHHRKRRRHSNRKKRKRQQPDLQVPLRVTAQAFLGQVHLVGPTTIGGGAFSVKIILSQSPSVPNYDNQWPEIGGPVNANIKKLNFSLGSGGLQSPCEIPVVQQNGNIEPRAWQNFLECFLAISVARTNPDEDFRGFIDRQDPVYLLLDAFNQMYSSSLTLTDSEVAIAIYESITLRPATNVNKDRIEAAIQEVGLLVTVSDILFTWFHSNQYAPFDFLQNPFLPRLIYRVKGELKNIAGKSLSLESSEVSFRSELENRPLFQPEDLSSVLKVVATNAGAGYELEIYLPKFNFNDFSVIVQFDKLGYAPTRFSLPIVSGISSTREERLSLKDVILVPMDTATPDLGGAARAVDGSVTVEVPPGAVASSTTLSIGTTTNATLTLGQTSVNALSFLALPDINFSKPVNVKIRVPATFLTQLQKAQGDTSFDEGFLVLTNDSANINPPLEAGEWEALSGSIQGFDENGQYVISAQTDHFSTFFLVPQVAALSQVNCTYRPARSRIICSLNQPGVHPLATLLEKRSYLHLPVDMPFWINHAKNVLNQGGWDGSLLNDIPGNFVIPDLAALGISNSCLTSSCIDFNIKPPVPQFLGSNIQISSVGFGRVFLNAQAEQCGVNPTISYPQTRVNSVDATAIAAGVAYSGQLYDLNQSCLVESCWWVFCWPEIQTCQGSLSVTGGFGFNNANQPMSRDGSGNWYSLGSPSLGQSAVPVPQFALSLNRWSEQNRSYIDPFVDKIKVAVSGQVQRAFAGMVNGLPGQLAQRLNNANMNNPNFTEDNCFLPLSPNPILLEYQKSFGNTVLNNPWQIGVDNSGNIFTSFEIGQIAVFDNQENFLRDFSVFTVNDDFSYLFGFYLDPVNSQVYVGNFKSNPDVNDSLLNVYDINGQQTGSFGAAVAANRPPFQVLMNSAGDVFVMTKRLNGVEQFGLTKYNSSGQKIAEIATLAIQPFSMALSNSQQRLFVSDYSQNRIFIFDFDLQAQNFYADTDDAVRWGGIDYDEANDVLIAFNSAGKFIAFEANGNRADVPIVGTLPANGVIGSILDINVNISNEKLYIVDLVKNQIHKFKVTKVVNP